MKEPTITELPDGSAIVSFDDLTNEELKIFAGIGLLQVIKDAATKFTADLDAATKMLAQETKTKTKAKAKSATKTTKKKR